MRNLERDGAVVAQVGGPENSGHSAAGDRRIDAVVVELRSGFESVEKSHAIKRSEKGADLTVSGKPAG
jgi:hypothetical protein